MISEVLRPNTLPLSMIFSKALLYYLFQCKKVGPANKAAPSPSHGVVGFWIQITLASGLGECKGLSRGLSAAGKGVR